MPCTAANVVSEPYPELRIFYPALIGGAASVWFCFHFGLGWYWYAVGIVFWLIIATALSQQATLDYAQRKVYEHSRLFGRRVVGIREFPFSEVEALVYLHRANDSEDTTAVVLRFRSGRRIWIRSFSAGGTRRGRDAEEFAWRLHCDTGIEIDEHTG